MMTSEDVLFRIHELLSRLDALEKRLDWLEETHGEKLDDVANELIELSARIEEL